MLAGDGETDDEEVDANDDDVVASSPILLGVEPYQQQNDDDAHEYDVITSTVDEAPGSVPVQLVSSDSCVTAYEAGRRDGQVFSQLTEVTQNDMPYLSDTSQGVAAPTAASYMMVTTQGSQSHTYSTDVAQASAEPPPATIPAPESGGQDQASQPMSYMTNAADGWLDMSAVVKLEQMQVAPSAADPAADATATQAQTYMQ